jgi:hypothetical protein
MTRMRRTPWLLAVLLALASAGSSPAEPTKGTLLAFDESLARPRRVKVDGKVTHADSDGRFRVRGRGFTIVTKRDPASTICMAELSTQ